jgi:hypothetical protein
MIKHKDLTGQKFGKVTAITKVPTPKNSSTRSARWLCRCDCGKEFVTISNSIVSGRTKTCGCSAGQHQITHGKTKTPEFKLWLAIKERCGNPNHKAYTNYGGRGIFICDRWLNFQNFYDDMCPRPAKNLQLDRIDNNIGYSKENCRWVTQQENLRNKRNNFIVTLHGKTMTAAEAAQIIGLSRSGVINRIKSGIPLEAPRIKRLLTKSL